MTYTESSELPKEGGYYWIKVKYSSKYYSKEHGQTEFEGLLIVRKNCYHKYILFYETNYIDEFRNSRHFKHYYLPIAYCKIERPL